MHLVHTHASAEKAEISVSSPRINCFHYQNIFFGSKCPKNISFNFENRSGGAYLALAHGHARAVPEALLCLGLFIVIVPAWAEWGAQVVLVLCQALDDDSCHRFVHAEVSSTPADQ